MKHICVFCGSSSGARPEYLEAARSLGRALTERSLGLVYGGAGVGLMGELARTVLAAGGEVIGVIPEALADREVALRELKDLRIVRTMHQRKALMAELSDGFVALPGGLGTLDEMCEVLTWAQLGLHRKPCGLVDTSGFFHRLLDFLDHIAQEAFMRPEHREMLLSDPDPGALLDRLASYRPRVMDKAEWILGLENGPGRQGS